MINISFNGFSLQSIMRNLVRRYVTVEQRKAENQGVTEDDVNEIKQDISAFRCELVEILKDSGMNTSTASAAGQGIRPRGSKCQKVVVHISFFGIVVVLFTICFSSSGVFFSCTCTICLNYYIFDAKHRSALSLRVYHDMKLQQCLEKYVS